MALTIAIGSDHAGLGLKSIVIEHLAKKGFTVNDLGPNSADSVDYPVFARLVCDQVAANGGLGILICGTGLGMSIAANKCKGIRAALCHNEFSARMSRAHNDANVLCLGERVTGVGVALAIVDDFLGTDFEGGRHARRVDLLEA